MELRFEEGDTVDEGVILAVIDDTAAALALELKKAEEKEAILNAANEVNLEDAKNSEELASAEAEAYKELRREGTSPTGKWKRSGWRPNALDCVSNWP